MWAADRNQENMPKVQFHKKYGAITSKIAKAGLMPSGLHGVRCMGMPLTRLKAFRTTIGRCLPGKHAGRSLTWRLALHQCDPIHQCRIEPIVAWAEAVWDEQLDDADLHKGWRRQLRLVGLKPSWSKVSGPTGAIIVCLRQLGWTWPHHTTFVTASGHAADLPQGRQSAGDSGQRIGAVERVGGQRRKELLPPFAGTCHTGKEASPTSTARGASDQGGFGCDTSGMVDARGGEQGGNR